MQISDEMVKDKLIKDESVQDEKQVVQQLSIANISSMNLLLKEQCKELIVIAGPCTIESREDFSILESVALLNEQQKIVHALRGGSYKPRTSPNSFQGLGREALEILREARERTGLPIVTEIMDLRNIELFLEMQVDIFQVGSRNMQNYELLKELGRYNVPVLLKRGLAADFDEVKGAIDYLKFHHADRPVMLCLRGLKKMDYGVSGIAGLRDSQRGQNIEYRFFSDAEDIKKAKEIVDGMKNVIVGFDPSHVAGHEKYVREISESAVENGADFLMIEVIRNESQRPLRQCDGKQAVVVNNLNTLLQSCRTIYGNRID